MTDARCNALGRRFLSAGGKAWEDGVSARGPSAPGQDWMGFLLKIVFKPSPVPGWCGPEPEYVAGERKVIGIPLLGDYLAFTGR